MEMPPLPTEYEVRIRAQFPAEADELLASLAFSPGVSVRTNPAKLDHPPFLGRPVPWCAYGTLLPTRPRFTLDPRWHAGAYYVQEASSMAIQAGLDAWADIRFSPHTLPADRPPLRLLDLCAAPGGKSTLLATWKQTQDLLLANETVPARRVILRENLQKWGSLGCYVGGFAPAQLPGDSAWDVVLVDAPCSGEGLFRREPVARTQWSDYLIATCARLQQDILAEAIRLLAPDGLLIFSTCTAAAPENVSNSEWLAASPILEVIPLLGLLESGWLSQGVGYLALPHRVPGEGFFLSCFRKTRASAMATDVALGQDSTSNGNSIERELKALLAVTWPPSFAVYTSSDATAAYLELPAHHEFWRKPISKKGRQNGTLSASDTHQPTVEPVALLGGRKGQTWIPSAPSVLITGLNLENPAFDVDLDTALQLLAGQTPAAALTGHKGWQAISYAGLPLLWTKQMGNRYNAVWPKPWRIRMRLD